MSDWTDFLTTLDFATLVPPEFDRYQPAIVDGLNFFLDNLPAERALAILADQLALPEEASVDERLVAIARHCPALHKLGQVLARDRRLPPRFRGHLQSLETMRPAVGLEEIRGDLERELGPLDALGVSVDEEPLAEASVAIVVPFAWRDGKQGLPGGVFKLLKPGIEAKLEEDLDLLHRIGALLDERCRRYGLPDIDYAGTFAQVRELLASETRLDREQQHLRWARTAYANRPSVLIPEVYPFSTPRLTAMQRVYGRKVTDVDGLSEPERRALAGTIAEALIAHPIWSPGPSTMFHADPHAGNLLSTTDGRLAILDWSLVGHLAKEDQVQLCRIMFGAIALDAEGIVRAIGCLAQGTVEADALRRVVDAHLGRIRHLAWPGLSWLTALMDDAVTLAGARFGADLVVFRKVLQTLKGVVADVSEESRVDWVLAASFLRQLGLEWGRRMVMPPYSRDFATHVSTMDLAQLLLFAPLTASQYWLGLPENAFRAAS